MKKAIVILNEAYGKDPKSTDVYYPLTTILEAMEKYADQFRQPAVIKSVCDHPNRQREYYHDGAYKCWRCHKIIVAS